MQMVPYTGNSLQMIVELEHRSRALYQNLKTSYGTFDPLACL